MAARAENAPPKPRPNLVIIFTDDQGYADVGVFGAKGFTTPHLDRLASQGCVYRNFHAAQPVCSASRCALLTGCYPNRLGIHGALGPRSAIGISDREMTLAQLVNLYYEVNQLQAVTTGDGRWKLQLPHTYRTLNGRPGGRDGLPAPYDNRKLEKAELYDLDNDLSEATDVAAQHPDLVRRLEAEAEKARAELGDALTKQTGTGRREPGRLPAP